MGQSHFDSCDNDWVTLGKGDICTEDGAYESTFDHRQYGSGKIFRGCGVDTGYDGDCCNCWKFRAGNAMLNGAAALPTNSSKIDADTPPSAGDIAVVNSSSSLRGTAAAKALLVSNHTDASKLVGSDEPPKP